MGINTEIICNLGKRNFLEAPRDQREFESNVYTLDLDDGFGIEEKYTRAKSVMTSFP